MDKLDKLDKLDNYNYSELLDYCGRNGVEYEQNAPLAPLSSMKVGGVCDVLVKPQTTQQIKGLVELCKNNGLKLFVLGKGTNVMFGDYHGVILNMAEFNAVSVDGGTITAQAGASLTAVCRAALEHSLSGVECLFGIPGSVGGALYMNAGAYGAEMKDVVQSAEVLNSSGEIVEISANEMDLSYRHSAFQGRGDCILSVTMKLADGNAEEIKAKMDEVMQKRKDKQPLEYPSCGSTFKRPKEGFAAAMIEECGLKGYSIGGAQVSAKHSGFVINKGGATLADIRALVEHVKKTVLAHNGVELECEMMIIENQSLFT